MSTRDERWSAIDASVIRVRTPDVVPDHYFFTISGEDWRRAIARARAEPNVAWAQIRTRLRALRSGVVSADPCVAQKILDAGLGVSQSGNPGNLTTENTNNIET